MSNESACCRCCFSSKAAPTDRRANAPNRLLFFTDGGVGRSLADVTQYRCVQGYLFFAAPTGQWASGAYELAVGGDVGLRIPFEVD